jgi:hypothetical protein
LRPAAHLPSFPKSVSPISLPFTDKWGALVIVGTPAYHPGFPLCIQFTIQGDHREST